MGIWDEMPKVRTMQEAVEVSDAGTRDKQIERLRAALVKIAEIARAALNDEE